jgi:hypothetical protein
VEARRDVAPGLRASWLRIGGDILACGHGREPRAVDEPLDTKYLQL